MDVVRAFIGVDRLEVHDVAHHLVFARNAVAAMHVAGDAGDIERLAAIVALDDRDHLGRELPGVDQPADAQRRLQAESGMIEITGHPGQPGVRVGFPVVDTLTGEWKLVRADVLHDAGLLEATRDEQANSYLPESFQFKDPTTVDPQKRITRIRIALLFIVGAMAGWMALRIMFHS